MTRSPANLPYILRRDNTQQFQFVSSNTKLALEVVSYILVVVMGHIYNNTAQSPLLTSMRELSSTRLLHDDNP